MDEKSRNTGMETTESEENPQKPHRRRRTPSAEPSDKSDVKSKRRSRSHSRSRSASPARNRRRRSRSRSPDRRWGRFNNRGSQRDFYNNRRGRRSPSPYRGRNRNRRSRSSSYNDRYRNRRNNGSRDRSSSQTSQPPQAPPAPNFQNEYVAGPPHYQEYPVAQQGFHYDYVPMMQVPPTAFPVYPPPPAQEYQWNTQVPPPPMISCPPVQEPVQAAPIPTVPVGETEEERQKREAAIAAEKKIQRDTIRKQRDDYIRRASALKRELIVLKEQREELISGNEPPSPTTHSFVKENDRLQNQIENKIGTIENVIEMLNGILCADKSDTESPKKPPKPPTKAATPSDDDSPERLKTKALESLSKKRRDSDRNRDEAKKSKPMDTPLAEQINFTFFDPEQHWCKVCNAFPKTAKEYLLHLHSEEHKNNSKPPDIPWHEHLVKDDMPTYPNAPTKRTPIRGLQFFTPSTAWYCKLCCFWIGDLHCASSHLKSKTHAREYDKYIAKNPIFETEWADERQKAFDVYRKKEMEQKQKAMAPPSPPMISAQKQNMAPPPPSSTSASASSYMAARDPRGGGLFDGIPLQINQRAKEPPKEVTVNEESEKKKGKKKKKEKKKRKKSKKKHRHSSSSSSSSSDDSSVSRSPERKTSVEKIIDSSTSIRVAMRNAVNAAPPPPPPPAQRVHLKPKSDNEEDTNANSAGGWTVVQTEQKVIPPKPPTISANGEAQNRRDEAMISQWTPLPVISEKEKQLFEQLKGKLKNREEKKKEKSPVAKPAVPTSNARPNAQRSPETGKIDDRRRNDSEKEFKDIKEKGRRDASYRRRSRSHSRSHSRSSTPRRDRRSRSPRRDRRRRSRSASPRRDRRYSRSPRRDRRRNDRYSRSRSRSRDRRTEKNDVKSDKNNADKSNAGAKKTTMTITGKKLPFIGRMPVFKKQTEDDSKKQDPQQTINEKMEEEKLLQKKKQEELKLQIQHKQQLLQLQQKQAEAYNLAHPGQFANIYNTHGTIHHILPGAVPEEYELMADPMHYAAAMMAAAAAAAPPPPMPMPEPEPTHFVEEANEPVLPPGIDMEEAENMELETVVPPPPPKSDKDNLPKDFQDALSIIFDKGAGTASETTEATTEPAPAANADENVHEIQHVVMQDETSTFAQMDMSSMDSQHSQVEQNVGAGAMGAANMDLEEQSQYALLYGDEQQHYMVDQVQQQSSAEVPGIDLATQSIPTPPIQVIDAAGNLTQIPGPVLEVGNDFVMLDADGNRIENYASNVGSDASTGIGVQEHNHDIELQNKLKQQELDDLAMLGIDADDLAAQCI